MPRKKVALWSAGVCIALAGGLAVALPALNRDAESSASDTAAQRTAEVTSGSLAAGITVSGVLSRGEPTAMAASGEGIITWLPEAGASIEPGEVLYEVNGQPVFLLPGAVPLWRTVGLGDEGSDVLALNEALRDLGLLDDSLADDVFGPGASSAVAPLYTRAGYDAPTDSPEGTERSQVASDALSSARSALTATSMATSASNTETAASGGSAEGSGDDAAAEDDAATEDEPGGNADTATSDGGEEARTQVRDAERRAAVASHEWIDPADVVMLDVPVVRIESLSLKVGDAAGGEVLRWTGGDVVATADVTDSQAAALSAGAAVELTLPTSQTVPGEIAEVTLGAEDAAQATQGRVVVGIEDQEAVADDVGAAVQIDVIADTVEDSLTMPVTALVALAEGGYAVEKVTAAGTELVPVEVQLVAEAQVAVSSRSLQDGDEVVVP